MKLTYKELDLSKEKDIKTMNRILSFDTNKNCFGDYDFYSVADEYINLAIYIKNKLIGYVGFSYLDRDEKLKYTITICIREDCQGQGIGDIVLKQTLNTLFDDYNLIAVNVSAVEDNGKCNKLLIKNNFHRMDYEDEFLRNGTSIKLINYMYTDKDYIENEDTLKIYKKITH